MDQLKIWAIIPARSGSKGLPGKNVRLLSGLPLIAHAINFAKAVGVFDKIILSTDSLEYAEIGKMYGAWIPFLRASQASQDDSMEEDILKDFHDKLLNHKITPPDIIVWLRPTFPFRSIDDLKQAISKLDDTTESVRLVTEGEPRLYEIKNDCLVSMFNDRGRSMIRRQEFPNTYKVYHTDIFWYRNIDMGVKFLGSKVKAFPIHKLCAMDVDGIEDFDLIEALIGSKHPLINRYFASINQSNIN